MKGWLFLIENLNKLIHNSDFVSKLTLSGALKVLRTVCPLNNATLMKRIEEFVQSNNTNSSITSPKRVVIGAVRFFVRNKSSILITEDVLNYLSLRFATDKLNSVSAILKPIDSVNQVIRHEGDEDVARYLKKRIPKKFFPKSEKSVTAVGQKSSEKELQDKHRWHRQKMLELYFERGFFREDFLNISKRDFSDIIWQMLNTQDPYLFELLRDNERTTLRKNFISSLSKKQSKAFIEQVVKVHFLDDFRIFTLGWDSLENILGAPKTTDTVFEKLQLFFDISALSNSTNNLVRFQDMLAHILSSRGNELLALVATPAWESNIAPSLIGAFNSFDSDNKASGSTHIDQLAVTESFERLGALSGVMKRPLKNGDLQVIAEGSSKRLLITLRENVLSSVASQILTDELAPEFTHSELVFTSVIKLFVKDAEAQRIIIDEANLEIEEVKNRNKKRGLLSFILKFQLANTGEKFKTTLTEFTEYLKESSAVSGMNPEHDYVRSYFLEMNAGTSKESETLLELDNSITEMPELIKPQKGQDYLVEQKVAVLEFYAAYGFFPWWSETNTFNAVINDLIRHKSVFNHHLISILAKLIHEYALLDRILNQESKETINLFGLFIADFDELNKLWIKKLNRSAKPFEDSIEQKDSVNSSTAVFERIYHSDNDDDIELMTASMAWVRPLLKCSKHLFDFNISPTWWRFEVLNFATNRSWSEANEKEFFQKFIHHLADKMKKGNELEKMILILNYLIESVGKNSIERSLQAVCTEQLIVTKKALESKTIATQKQNEQSKNVEQTSEVVNGLEVAVQNAGMILVWPFLNHLFSKLSMLQAVNFKDDDSKNRAVYLLQYLVFGEIEFPEYELTLNKILCGIPTSTHLTTTKPISSKEKAILIELLDALILNWKAVSNSSHEAIQETFFRRKGSLKYADDKVILTVEKKGVDVLLTSIPWNFTLIKLPWMSLPLHIVWRNEQ